MINVLLNGCNGKMGTEIIKQIEKYPNMVLSCGFDIYDKKNNNFPVYQKLDAIKCPVDVIIDFSTPKATLKILEFASKNSLPVVIATTGFSESDFLKIQESANIIPIFQAANMSLTINVFSKILEKVAPLFKNTDIEIIETHHNQKEDAPSGTALLLADSLNKSLNNKMVYTFNRTSSNKKREKNEIGFSAIRGGNIVGEHTVKFFSNYDNFELTHTAYSRNIFADGALRAAEFLVNKPKGMYNMDDLIANSFL